MQTRLTKRHPYPDQLLPGKSLFDLAQVGLLLIEPIASDCCSPARASSISRKRDWRPECRVSAASVAFGLSPDGLRIADGHTRADGLPVRPLQT